MQPDQSHGLTRSFNIVAIGSHGVRVVMDELVATLSRDTPERKFTTLFPNKRATLQVAQISDA
jgi:hypothetical protein